MNTLIGERGTSRYGHLFGGQRWSVTGPAGSEPAPALILTLDLADEALEFSSPTSRLLPLCSRIDEGVTLERQSYSFDPAARVVTFSGPAWSVSVDPADEVLAPLPEREITLRPLAPPEDPDQTEDAEDTFAGGDAFLRVGGRPLWLQDPEEAVCDCGRPMSFIACVGSENYRSPSGIISPSVPLFFGEHGLYFFACFECCRVDVVLQST